MNAPFTNEDRQAGKQAMEKSLTPLARALRRFGAGAPVKKAGVKGTPMGAVMFVNEQRRRLESVLAKEKDLVDPRITSAAVVIRVLAPSPDPADTIRVDKGAEGQAVQLLQMYPVEFAVVGVMFAVQAGEEKRPFVRLVDNSLEGKAALAWAVERQLQRTPQKTMS